MAIPAQYTFAASDTAAICALQTTGGAGSFLINGALADPSIPPGSQGRVLLTGGFGRVITLTSAGNISGVNFTIAGTDVYGRAVSSTIAGPNANTVATTQEYLTVTGVTVNGAVGTNTSVGTGTVGSTRPYRPSGMSSAVPANIALYGVIANTINWTVQDSPTDINGLLGSGGAPSGIAWFNHPTLAGQVANASSNYAFPVMWVRCVVNSAGATGTLQFTIRQAGI